MKPALRQSVGGGGDKAVWGSVWLNLPLAEVLGTAVGPVWASFPKQTLPRGPCPFPEGSPPRESIYLSTGAWPPPRHPQNPCYLFCQGQDCPRLNDNHLFLIGQILCAKAEHRVSVRGRCG